MKFLLDVTTTDVTIHVTPFWKGALMVLGIVVVVVLFLKWLNSQFNN